MAGETIWVETIVKTVKIGKNLFAELTIGLHVI